MRAGPFGPRMTTSTQGAWVRAIPPPRPPSPRVGEGRPGCHKPKSRNLRGGTTSVHELQFVDS
eukprot:6979175-Alexandrium_andersonii.AAC.1